MPPTASRLARGALAGAAAAGVWAVQQPLDERVFGVPYDDALLLGSWVAPGRAAYPVGVGLHVLNGAVFGALYAAARPSVFPAVVPGVLRGPLAGLAEHLASWPATAFLPRVHPSGGSLPVLWGSGRAFAQATWRHLLFGAVLGELERRLNPGGGGDDGDGRGLDAEAVRSNGHADHAPVVVVSGDPA